MRALALGVVVFFAVGLLATWGPPPTGAAPAVSAGCPACHGAAGKEPGLAAVAKAIKNHPTTAANTVQQCALCHRGQGPTPPPFRTILHKVHISSAKFTTTYKGTCTSCHSVDKATGTVTVIGLTK